MTEFEPKVMEAALEQYEAMMRDTILRSVGRIEQAAKESGCSPWLAIDMAGLWAGYLMEMLPDLRSDDE